MRSIGKRTRSSPRSTAPPEAGRPGNFTRNAWTGDLLLKRLSRSVHQTIPHHRNPGTTGVSEVSSCSPLVTDGDLTRYNARTTGLQRRRSTGGTITIYRRIAVSKSAGPQGRGSSSLPPTMK